MSSQVRLIYRAHLKINADQSALQRDSIKPRVKRFYDLTAKLLSGDAFSFSALKGKVVLIENVASL